MNTKEFVSSSMFRNIVLGIAGLVFMSVVFHAGMFMGYHRASFSYRGGENYYRTFGDKDRGPMGMMRGNFPNAHGSIGTIVKIELPQIVIADQDKTEKTIIIKDDTEIRRLRETITSPDLKVGDAIVVFGEPNEQGQIEAKLIRCTQAISAMMHGGRRAAAPELR